MFTFAGYNDVSKPGFIGCLRDIVIGSVPENSQLEKSNFVTNATCIIKDLCTPNPCEHGGECRQDADTFYCDCSKTGYTGALCHTCMYLYNYHAPILSYLSHILVITFDWMLQICSFCLICFYVAPTLFRTNVARNRKYELALSRIYEFQSITRC